MAPAETYTPPLSFFFIERVSLRNSLFSDELIFDLSIPLISCNRTVNVFVSAALIVVGVESGVVFSLTVAFKGVDINVNMRTVDMIAAVSFFILIVFMREVINFMMQR